MIYDVIIIGAGQAGLSAGAILKEKKFSFLILDESEAIGGSWKRRYDSLKLLTPRAFSVLPGLKMHGDQDLYPTKDEVTEYLQKYAKKFNLPILLDSKVISVEKKARFFKIETSNKKFIAKKTIVAVGTHSIPKKVLIPIEKPNKSLFQIHSSLYKNPQTLTKKTTLVVGAGNSGVQIAIELSKNRKVFLATGHKLKIAKKRLFNKSIDYWLDRLHLLTPFYELHRRSILGKYFYKSNVPVILENKDDLKNKNLILKKRVIKIKGNTASFADNSQERVKNIVWATGFESDYSWIKIRKQEVTTDDILNDDSALTGVGLFFLGIPWLNTRESHFLSGVHKDAMKICNIIEKQLVNSLDDYTQT